MPITVLLAMDARLAVGTWPQMAAVDVLDWKTQPADIVAGNVYGDQVGSWPIPATCWVDRRIKLLVLAAGSKLPPMAF